MPNEAALGHDVRHRARSGELSGPTAGLAPGLVQANIAIVPQGVAGEYEAYCRANERACPILAIGKPGDPALPELGEIDIRTDLPRYRIYRDGAFAEERLSVADLWSSDMVTFAIGCSFTFEHALLQSGIALRHVSLGRNVAMYRTSIATAAVGRFGGPLVVSMRPIPRERTADVTAICARFGRMHGAPIHAGDPARLGIADLARPDYGEAVPIEPGEDPVFWACGVTSQAALEQARLPLLIAHAPGCMLVTDRPHAAFATPLAA